MQIGIDTGGTFTDLILQIGTRQVFLKVASTPDDPSRAVLEGIEQILDLEHLCPEKDHPHVIHGSTVATNALLERKGGRTGFVTTEGLGDVLSIGRQTRLSLYDLQARKPEPLVQRSLVFECKARCTNNGTILDSPSRQDLARLRKKLKKCNVTAIAIGFLHSYANGTLERKVASSLASLGIPISLSHEVVGEFREYERFSTAAVNAYVTPPMKSYLGNLEQKIGQNNLRIMHSAGGTISTRTATEFPVHTVLSGPAGGLVGALQVAKKAGFPDIMTLDMGGTSTDVALAKGQLPASVHHDFQGLPVRAPALEIHTVGAGGGSLADRDPGGALKVGPKSAGANPGPACYGRKGGGAITVTDAHVALGRLPEEAFLGGKMKTYPERSTTGMATLARKLKLSPRATALGILAVTNSTMERALKVISVERGHDPRDFTLVAFGGAGGLHAAELAEQLQIPRILVPRNPGLLSALGMLLAEPERSFSQTCFLDENKLSPIKLKATLRPLVSRAKKELQKEGVPATRIRIETNIDIRYRGQSHEIPVPFKDKNDVIRSFHRLHQKRYGHSDQDQIVEGVTLRVRASGKTTPPRSTSPKQGGKKPSAKATLARRRVSFSQGNLLTPFLGRDLLLCGNHLDGPAIILEYSSTTVVPPNFSLTVDPHGNLLLKERKK